MESFLLLTLPQSQHKCHMANPIQSMRIREIVYQSFPFFRSVFPFFSCHFLAHMCCCCWCCFFLAFFPFSPSFLAFIGRKADITFNTYIQASPVFFLFRFFWLFYRRIFFLYKSIFPFLTCFFAFRLFCFFLLSISKSILLHFSPMDILSFGAFQQTL